MAYIYRRLCTSVDHDTLITVLRTLYNIRYRTHYASILTRAWSVGRPLKDALRRRWFDTVDVPNQMWLPFEEFTPASVTRMDLIDGGMGYYIECRCETGQQYNGVYYLVDDKNRRDNTIRAIEIYQREEVREEVLCNFILNPRTGAINTEYNYLINKVSYGEIASHLVTILRLSYVRCTLEHELSMRFIRGEHLTIDKNTGLVYDDNGAIVLQITEVREESRNSYFYDRFYTFKLQFNRYHPLAADLSRESEGWYINIAVRPRDSWRDYTDMYNSYVSG